jgi:hypothetical protein
VAPHAAQVVVDVGSCCERGGLCLWVPPLVVVLLPELVDFDEEPQAAMATAAIARTATLMVLLDAIVTMICPLR